MNPTWKEIGEVFDAAAALPAGERAGFLAARCGSDVELRREVESLLQQDEGAAGYLQPPTGEIAARLLGPTEGAVVGGFRLRGRIGAGGMGNVHEAEQKNPARRVALKILPPLSAAPEVRVRFAHEAELLARMNHPSIARVYSSGVDGETPYLAMELVEDALPITAYVRREGLNTRATIELFRVVCDAVAHGHARGVIHRDLKPSNVLVDRTGTPKLIDFGVARAIDVVDQDGPRMTRTGELVGTLQYMSPEQAEGLSKDVQGQSDVHGLGLLLYELLCGQPARSVEGKSMTQTLRSIAEETVPPVRRVRADLPPAIEWILGKALEPDRTRRYASVVELDQELERFLAHEPVLAGPRSSAYAARLWMRRHPTASAVIAVSIVSVAIVAALAVRTISRERDVFRLSDAERLRTLEKRAETMWPALIELERRAGELWPARSELAADMRSWLADAKDLYENLDEHRATLASLRARAKPRTPEQERQEMGAHARAAELRDLQGRLELRRAVAERRRTKGIAVVSDADASAYDGIDDWRSLQSIAETAVNPDRPSGTNPAAALALARRALSMPGADQALVLDTIAWAHFALGDDAGALDAGRRAMDVDADEEALIVSQERLHGAIELAGSPEGIAESEQEIADMARRVEEWESEARARQRWSFDDPSDAWWHDRLTGLVAGLELLMDPERGLVRGVSPAHGIGVERRLKLAELTERSLTENAEQWQAASRAVAEDPRFQGLVLAPQMGLVPLGADPDSGLQEFADLASGTIPVRSEQGRIAIRPEHAVVFVLIPPGRFVLGAQSTDPSGPQFDPQATPAEGPPRRLDLAAFFLSKYELTQDQWRRATAENPSYFFENSKTAGEELVGPMHPVEQMNWLTAKRFLERFGWTFPTEAQWEYAARAGTTTPWWTGSEPGSLQGAANLTDRHCKKFGPAEWTYEETIDDGYVAHAPIGRFRANGFGLHDVTGNVNEWCADEYKPHTAPRRAGDGLVLGDGDDVRVLRGGSFELCTAFNARSSYRNAEPMEEGSGNSGVRPARPLTH